MLSVRRATLVTALGLLPLTTATPTAAAPVGAGLAIADACSGLHCFYATITVDVQPIGRSELALVTWNCQATGTINPASTAVTACTVGPHAAEPTALPGPYAATAGATAFAIGTRVVACVGGESTFLENIVGEQRVGTDECAPLVVAHVNA